MGKPLTITSQTNVHALASYFLLGFIGTLFLIREEESAINRVMGDYGTAVTLGWLGVGGFICFWASIVGAFRKDPTRSLKAEAFGLLPILGSLGFMLYSFVDYYGAEVAPFTVGFISIFLFACGGRLVQAVYELVMVRKVRQSKLRETVEVPAKPEEE